METPSISSSNYTTSTYVPPQNFNMAAAQFNKEQQQAYERLEEVLARKALEMQGFVTRPTVTVVKPERVIMRIVKVFIADPTEDLPLDKRVLWKGEEQLTDLTDQELFFEVPIMTILGDHNALRRATVNKKATDKAGRDVMLEPIRIRDLKMVVVNVAEFK